MSDTTGHMDRPGAGPFSTNEFVNGIPTGHYTHENPETGLVEVLRTNPPGTPDMVLKEFPDWATARIWLRDEWLAGRLK